MLDFKAFNFYYLHNINYIQLVMFFINEVFAGEMTNSVAAPTFQSFTASLVPLLIFVAIFYFLLIRPQQKKQREHEEEVASLKPGDRIVTAGGIYGIVKKVKEHSFVVEIANNVEIEVVSETVALAKDVDEAAVAKIAPTKKNKTSDTNKKNK